MLTMARPETFENLQLNAGIFLKNFDYSRVENAEGLIQAIKTASEDKEKYFGATKGGGTFSAVPTMRRIEVDGMRAPIVGSQVIDEWTVKLTTTLAEITAENMKAAFATGETAKQEKITTVKIRTDLNANDYIDKLCWIGDISDGSYVLIDITKALNTAGATLNFTDKGEGNIPVEFVAHQTEISSDYVPCTIIFISK